MAAAGEPYPKRLKYSNVIPVAPSAPTINDLYPHISTITTIMFFQDKKDSNLAELYKLYPTEVVLNCINASPHSWHSLDITLKKQCLELNFVLSNIGHTHPHISREIINMFFQDKYCPELNTLYNLYTVEVVLECINSNFSTWNILDINLKKQYLDIFIDTQKLF